MGDLDTERADGGAPMTVAAADASLHVDDLIDDRALTSEDDDQFRLRDVVEEIAQLCESSPVPATLALYGSWGSGKSSLANLLRAKFIRNRKVAFARFNAFKYAEVPLRRHFISQLADAFKVGDEEFAEGLYSTSRDFRLRVPPGKWFGLLKAVLAAVIFTGVIAVAAGLAYAGLSDGAFGAEFEKAMRFGIPGVALAAPLLAAALGLLGSYFTAETTVEAPSSDEQFERVFRKLVKKIKSKKRCERIVIFIDELDRCSPAQVVSALETLRTFLEVKPCIFIVAADQQVLEHALTTAARQATPFNRANPYYSAGSAYLDKIFQYQLALPPILPRRLSRFALDLVETRQGVWAAIPNRAELVSVLVPTHVSSPRRVKSLLNSFALLYRLALKRSAAGAIEPAIETRASEIAKLVCLRTEFPLFAADLQLSHRLPEIVLHLHDDPEADEAALASEFLGVAPEALVRAGAYAREELPVDEVIARPARGRQAAPAVDDAEDVANEAEDDAETADAVEAVERSQARQLIRYLQRTREVDGPRRDLIYLESSGAAFGLSPELAEELEQAAVDGDVEEVEGVFATLDEADQQNAFRLLAWLIVEAVGIEAANVARSIFKALAVYKGDLAPVADDLLNALVTHSTGYTLSADDLAGALALALSADGDAATAMREEVLARDEALTDEELAGLILNRADELWEESERIAEVFAAALANDRAEEAAEALTDIRDELVTELVNGADVDSDEAIAGLASFVEIVQPEGRAAVAQAGFTRLASHTSDAAGVAVTSLIPLFAPISESAAAVAVMNGIKRRPLSNWVVWLAAVDPAVIPRLQKVAGAFADYLQRLWAGRFTDETVTEAEFAAVAGEIGRLRAPLAPQDDSAVDLLDGAPAAITAARATSREEQYEALRTLVNGGALDATAASASILADLSRALASPQPGTTGVGVSMSEYVLRSAPAALLNAGEDDVTAFVDAAEESTWLDATTLEILRVRSALAQRRLLGDAATPPPESTLQALLAAEEDAADEAVAAWITGFEPEPLSLFELLEPRTRDQERLPSRLENAVNQTSTKWTPIQKAELFKVFAPALLRGELDMSVISAVSLSDADPERASDTLIEAFESVGNNDERRAVMDLWRAVNPAPENVRRRLIDRIYIPLLATGKGGAGLALTYFDLVRDAPYQNTMSRVKKAISTAVDGDRDLEKRAEKRLQDAGWISKKRRWFQRK